MINPPQVLSEEPTAVTPHGGFCGGESQQWPSYPTKLHVRICEGGVERSTPLLDPATFWAIRSQVPPRATFAAPASMAGIARATTLIIAGMRQTRLSK
jgi:hypothetical protein